MMKLPGIEFLRADTAIYAMVFYLSITFFLRIAGLHDNVLYADDYLYFVSLKDTIISFEVCRFPVQDHRWIHIGNICISSVYFEDFALSPYPKVLANVFIAFFSFLTFIVFRAWGLGNALAILLPIILLTHPTVNEITLWNVSGTLSLIFFVVGVSYYLCSFVDKPLARVLGVLLLCGVAVTYEYYIVFFLLYALSEPVIRYALGRDFSTKKLLILISIFCAVSVFYIVQVSLSNWLFPDPFSFRGISADAVLVSGVSELLTKLRALSNVLINVYMTPLSFYIRLEESWSLWKWVPITMVVSTFVIVIISSRSLIKAIALSSFCLLITLAPLVPLIASSQTPESWRVSIPATVAVIFGLIPLLSHMKELFKSSLPSALIVVIVACLLGNASHAESNLRSFESSLESRLFDEISQFWEDKGMNKSKIGLGRIVQNYSPRVSGSHAAENLSIAFHRRGLTLSLKNTIAWRGHIIKQGFSVVEIEPENTGFVQSHSKGCLQASDCRYELRDYFTARCLNSPDYIQPVTGIRVAHKVDENLSVICL